VKNVQYAAAYWEEHRHNFREMVMRLLEDATVLKIAANAASLSLGYNHQKGTVPPQYNQKVIFPAYEVLEKQLNKTLLCDALDAYMQVTKVPHFTISTTLKSSLSSRFVRAWTCRSSLRWARRRSRSRSYSARRRLFRR
jgi:hypothetical protein